jgi:hypothetical protein
MIASALADLHRRDDQLRTLQQLRDRMQELVSQDPKNLDARGWLSTAWHNCGVVLVAMGRPAEAVSAFEQGIAQRRQILAKGPDTKARFGSVGDHYLGLASALRALGRPTQAAAMLWEHRELWEGDPDDLYKLARGLARCIPLLAKDQVVLSRVQREEVERCGDWAMDALRQAVAAGYRDALHMRGDDKLQPLHARAAFQALVDDLGFPSDPFAQPD